MVHAFERFWGTRTDHPEYQQQYIAAWTTVAKYFARTTRLILRPDEPALGAQLQGPAFEAGPLAPSTSGRSTRSVPSTATTGLLSSRRRCPPTGGAPQRAAQAERPAAGQPQIGYARSCTRSRWTRRQQLQQQHLHRRPELASWQTQVQRTAQRMDAPVLLAPGPPTPPTPMRISMSTRCSSCSTA
ncbi:hypothetical protein GXW82_28750 [Streptacidiphilus sp. 4-A2]|nr:hypothetical protein [Streptacidiphilus sp. 4-A2]